MDEKLVSCIVGDEGLNWAGEDYVSGQEISLPASVAVSLAGDGALSLPADTFQGEDAPDPEATPPDLEAPGEKAILEDVTSEPTDDPGPQVTEVGEELVIEISLQEVARLDPMGWRRWLASEEFGHWLVEKGFDTDHPVGREKTLDRLIFKGQKA